MVANRRDLYIIFLQKNSFSVDVQFVKVSINELVTMTNNGEYDFSFVFTIITFFFLFADISDSDDASSDKCYSMLKKTLQIRHPYLVSIYEDVS